MRAPSSNESDAEDFDSAAFIDRVINPNTFMGERIMVSNISIMARLLAIFWLVTFTRFVGPVGVVEIHHEFRLICKDFSAALRGGAILPQAILGQFMCKIW